MNHERRKRYAAGGQTGKSAGAGRRTTLKQRSGRTGKIFLALIAFCNLLLSLLLAVQRRQDTLRAVQENETVKVLLTAQKETKT